MEAGKPHFSILAMSFAGGPRPRHAALILGGLWLALFFAALFSPSILDDADGTHAQAARAMVETGDLVTLKVDGVRYLEKAPLPYWLVALSFRFFGFNTFGAHLPQALAVGLLMLLGHRWANQAFGARTGFYTALGILTSAGVFLFTRIFIPEVLLSLLLAVALFCFLKTLTPDLSPPVAADAAAAEVRAGEVRERPAVIWYAGPRFYAYVMWAALAGAVLTKGLVALVFFFGTTVAYLLLTDDWRRWRLLQPFSGLLLFLAIAAPWHILAGLRNTGGADGHGFFWFYFVNEHVLRFIGRRVPMDYNKLPGWLFWSLHLVWLFPWALFLPLGIGAIVRRFNHQNSILTATNPRAEYLKPRRRWTVTPYEIGLLSPIVVMVCGSLLKLRGWTISGTYTLLVFFTWLAVVPIRRKYAGLVASPFHRIDPQQRSILLLSLFAGLVLLFFSLSTNQEYYTFPAYLPLLLLIAATITRAEQAFSSDAASRRWIFFAHGALIVIGAAVAISLAAGLWNSRHLPFVSDIGDLLAHRGVGDYTLSMSHLFDLTGPSFAALRAPAVLAMLAFSLGPALAWTLRTQRRHLAATTAIAFTAAGFLFAAHIAFARFGSMLSSADFADAIRARKADHAFEPGTRVMLYGDQAFGSSIPFYLGRQVELVDARSTSMLFGSSFPDCPPVFLSKEELARTWGTGPRKVVFVPLERRDEVDRLLGARGIIVRERSGKALITDRPLASPDAGSSAVNGKP